jgi:hypothetical protein
MASRKACGFESRPVDTPRGERSELSPPFVVSSVGRAVNVSQTLVATARFGQRMPGELHISRWLPVQIRPRLNKTGRVAQPGRAAERVSRPLSLPVFCDECRWNYIYTCVVAGSSPASGSQGRSSSVGRARKRFITLVVTNQLQVAQFADRNQSFTDWQHNRIVDPTQA